MDPINALLGVAILALVLTANYFVSAWRLGILRAFGRRHPLTWRTLIAGSVAGCLPFAVVLVALAIVPGEASGDADGAAAILALQLSLCGFTAHVLNDLLVSWGSARRTA